jgi:hypothetical protein
MELGVTTTSLQLNPIAEGDALGEAVAVAVVLLNFIGKNITHEAKLIARNTITK